MAGDPASPRPDGENAIQRVVKASDELPDAVNLRELPQENLTALGGSLQASLLAQGHSLLDAEDLSQDAFIKAFRKEDIRSHHAWLKRVGTLDGITLGRRRTREKRALKNWYYLNQARAADDPQIEDAKLKLEDAVRRLPPRMIRLVRRWLAGKSSAAIGKEFGITGAKAKDLFSIACQQLRRILETGE